MASLTFSKQFYCHTLVLTIIATLAFFAVAETNSDDDFVRTSCGVTRYPDLCYKTLSSYASTIQGNLTQLANAALIETLKSAQSTSNMVQTLLETRKLSPREAGAVKDCVENMRDSVQELQRSLLEMKELEGPDFEMEMSNIQTWVSAALTDEDTCMDGFEEKATQGNIKDTIRSDIVTVAQLTSNALALIHKLS